MPKICPRYVKVMPKKLPIYINTIYTFTYTYPYTHIDMSMSWKVEKCRPGLAIRCIQVKSSIKFTAYNLLFPPSCPAPGGFGDDR